MHEKDTKNACVDFVEWQIKQKIAKIAVASKTQKNNPGRRASSLTSIIAAALGSSSSSCAPSWVFSTQDRQTESVTPAGVSLPVQSLPPSSSKLPKKKSSPGVGGSTIKVFFYFEGPGPQPNGINRVKLNSKTRIPRKSFENRDCYPKQI